MSIYMIEGFETHSTFAALTLKYLSASELSANYATAGRHPGTNAFSSGASGFFTGISPPFLAEGGSLANPTEIAIGFNIRAVPGVVTTVADVPLFEFFDLLDVSQFSIRWHVSGTGSEQVAQLSLVDHNNVPRFASPEFRVVASDFEWHHVAMRISLGGTTSLVEVLVDGLSLGTLPGEALGDSSYTMAYVKMVLSACEIDDIYIADEIQGDVYVRGFVPSTDVVSEWIPSSAGNAAQVDENNNDGDTSYVTQTSFPNTDLYQMRERDDLGHGAYDPAKGVGAQVNLVGRLTAPGSRDVAIAFGQGKLVGLSPSISIDSTTYAEHYRCFELNPSNSGPLSISPLLDGGSGSIGIQSIS